MLDRLTNSRILVVGDVMLDRYWQGQAARISPEAPCPVVRIESTVNKPGGAANVACNLAALNVPVTLLGWIGSDEAGAALTACLEDAGVDARLLVGPMPTITKLRVVSRSQQMIRLDFEEESWTADPAILGKAFDEALDQHRLVVFSDYGKGSLGHVSDLIARCRRQGVPAIVDPKGTDFSKYAGAEILTPNESEFLAIAGKPADEEDFDGRAQNMRRQLSVGALVITRGERGLSLFEAENPPLHLPADAREVFDVTGAGDTVVATLAAGLMMGLSTPAAARLANHAGGLVVARKGTATVSLDELLDSGHLHSDSFLARYPSTACTLQRIRQARARGERIVMTNGCFDLLHPGHVAFLEHAKALGDRLVVAVNDDASVTRLKGSARPINALAYRLSMLAALRSVDWVIPFSGSSTPDGGWEDTPRDIIVAVKPDVLVKGGDYRLEEVVGAAEVIADGGEVRILPLMHGHSTTGLISQIAESIG